MIEELREKIKGHMEEVEEGRTWPKDGVCRRCGRKSVSFGIHERRGRLFLLIAGQIVEKVLAVLIRWKCCECKGTFTEYPEWAEPHKRYLREQMLEKSLEYSTEEGLTYRRAMEAENRRPIFYDSSEEEPIDERSPSPTTLWNWVGQAKKWMAKVLSVTALIKEKEPESQIHRQMRPVDERKYKSEERRDLLEIWVRMALIRPEFERLYAPKKIFSPDF